MSSRIIPVQPFDYVVFGATGDLTKRKLIPALYHRFMDGQFDEQSRIIGVSRSKLSDAEFQKLAGDAVDQFVEKDYQDAAVIKRFLTIFSYVVNDVSDKSGWGDIKKALRDDPDVVRAFYLAVAPDLFEPIELVNEGGVVPRLLGELQHAGKQLGTDGILKFREAHDKLVDHG